MVPGEKDMRIRMEDCFKPPEMMGRLDMSKRTTLAKHGDSEQDVLRGLLVLRAWGCWRLTRRGFATRTPGRLMGAERERSAVMRGIRDFPAPLAHPLLGDEDAHTCLNKWVPGAVAALLVEGAAGSAATTRRAAPERRAAAA